MKEKAPSPIADVKVEVAISRPVVPERTGEGMIPPPPTKLKPPAPSVPEAKVNIVVANKKLTP